jgi:hypothetical protein
MVFNKRKTSDSTAVTSASRDVRGSSRGGRGGRGGSRGGRGASRGGRGGKDSFKGDRRERLSSDEVQLTSKKLRLEEPVIINDKDDDDRIEVASESQLNIQIAGGTLDSSYKDNTSSYADNVILDDFELPDDNEIADFKKVKSNEKKRQKENIEKELSDDSLSGFTEMSEKFAKSYVENIDKNNKELLYEREMKKLQEQIKEQNEQLKQLRTQQNQFGYSNQFQYPFQPQYNHLQFPFQPQYNPFLNPLQQINNNQFPTPSFHQPNVQPAQQALIQQPAAQVNFQQPIQEVNKTEESYTTLETKIRKANESACSDKNFAVKLLQIFFNTYELSVENLNVYGKNMRGHNEQKLALDAIRLDSIKERVMHRLDGDLKYKKMIWDQCVSAMNKKIKEIKDKSN